MMRIEEYGLIGDTETAALVGSDGSMDWLCLPRFDSDACFASLLGECENGFWQIAPAQPVVRTRRQYRGETLILETAMETAEGAIRLLDFMPPRDDQVDVVRIVEGLRGTVPLVMRLAVRFNYGSTIPWVRRVEGGTLAVAGPDALLLSSAVETHGEGFETVARFDLAAGEKQAFVLTYFRSHRKTPAAIDAQAALADTERFWQEWAGFCQVQPPWREVVLRSLITLKALTFAPTGGVLAAPTTSLPEWIGGVRNWDYRYCWLRDATLTLHALMSTGYTGEAEAWRRWLLRAVAGDPNQMQIMYGVAGERRLAEFELPHLRGYERSTPVRVGNAASNQFQLDVYGEVLAAMYQARKVGICADDSSWQMERHLVDFVLRHWREPDEGIWEIRGPRRHFTHSKVMAWVALDRAIRSVREFHLEGEVERWEAARDEIHAEVCQRGYHAEAKSFIQHFDSAELDASLLLLPLVGFLPASDERIRQTIEAIQRDLLVDGFVLRYRSEQCSEVDGLPPGEGAFLPCTFWLVDCLALLGRTEEARAIFERLLAIRNDLGLLAEEYDPREKRLLGNFPQAFSHVGLVNTALNLQKTERREHRSPGVSQS